MRCKVKRCRRKVFFGGYCPEHLDREEYPCGTFSDERSCDNPHHYWHK